MKQVISASRRTDIPAYYLNWFIDALHNGKLEVHNQLYRHNTFVVDLHPDKVAWIVFWSRNYKHLLKEYAHFSAYQLFFHFTIVSHSPLLERITLSINDAILQAQRLAQIFGPDRIIWRYDPVVVWMIGHKLYSNYNRQEFKQLCHELSELGIKHCYFSFASLYRKFTAQLKKKYPDWVMSHPAIGAQKQNIVSEMKEISKKSNMILHSCCNDNLVDKEIRKGACISGEFLNTIDREQKVSNALYPSRKDCGCTRAIDIGDYALQPCPTGCIYCYANSHRDW